MAELRSDLALEGGGVKGIGQRFRLGMAEMGDSSIFISYRREDTSGYAGHLYKDLASYFGEARVFLDVDGIPYGEDFREYITRVVGKSSALIALIGLRWTSQTDSGGQRRLDSPNDYVRLEIEAALSQGVRVIPVLVDGADMPSATELPEQIVALAQRQGIDIDNARWDYDVRRLMRALESIVGSPGEGASSLVPPKLQLSRATLDFGTLAVGSDWPRQSVQLRNLGGGELDARVTTNESWIVLRPRDDAVDVLIDTSYAGDYLGSLNVRSAGGDATARVIARIGAEPESVAGDAQQQSPIARGGRAYTIGAFICAALAVFSAPLFLEPVGAAFLGPVGAVLGIVGQRRGDALGKITAVVAVIATVLAVIVGGFVGVTDSVEAPPVEVLPVTVEAPSY